MFELRNERARNVYEWRIRLNDTAVDERSHTEMIVFHPGEALKLAPSKHQGTEIIIDRLQQRLDRRIIKASSANMLIASVAIDTNIISEVSFARATERLDSKDVAFFHALVGLRPDKGNLFVAMDMIAEDIVASDVSDCFDGDDLAFDHHLVALHYLLDGRTDMIDPSVNAGFL
jgi:hypothetical protein